MFKNIQQEQYFINFTSFKYIKINCKSVNTLLNISMFYENIKNAKVSNGFKMLFLSIYKYISKNEKTKKQNNTLKFKSTKITVIKSF